MIVLPKIPAYIDNDFFSIYKRMKIIENPIRNVPPLLRDLSKLRHWKHEELSKPEVGSSKNITGGLLTSSNAIDNLFLCPPLRLWV